MRLKWLIVVGLLASWALSGSVVAADADSIPSTVDISGGSAAVDARPAVSVALRRLVTRRGGG